MIWTASFDGRMVPGLPEARGGHELSELLVNELGAIGLSEVTMDEHGYVMGTIPATSAKVIGV